MTTHRTTLIVLGAGGDLTRRLLVPGLAGVLARDPGLELELVGAGHGDHDDAAWQALVRDALRDGLEALDTDVSVDTRERVARTSEAARWVSVDATDRAALAVLVQGAAHPVVLYFALPPQVTLEAVAALEPGDLPAGTRLALEKPFGANADDAAQLNGLLARLVPERDVFRVDHFLGKTTVLNLLGLRFANRLVEAVWNREHITRIDIVYDETLALEGRAGYYDRAGALVDMVQSHLLLVAGFVAMEPPTALEPDELHGALVTALEAMRLHGGDPETAARRARYTLGELDGRRVAAYVDEDGVDAALGTETLAELAVSVDTDRWAGVPITLRSGKAIGRPATTITLTFAPVEHLPRGFTAVPDAARLILSLTPERLAVDLDLNGPGDPLELERVRLDSAYGAGELTAYGEVLDGVLAGDPLLSVPAAAAELCWRLCDPVLAAWRADRVPLDDYAAGSGGPEEWRSPLAPARRQ